MDGKLIPIFPLNLVVFPGEMLKLHIFEPRYKQLINEVLNDEIKFVIPPYFDHKVQRIGTLIRLEKLENLYPNGEMDIIVRGESVVEILNFFKQAPGKLYGAGEIAPIDFDEESNPELSLRIQKQLIELYRLIKSEKEFDDQPENITSYRIGHRVGFSIRQEFELLGMNAEVDRQLFILNHLDRILPVIREIETTKDRIKQNGHFRKTEVID